MKLPAFLPRSKKKQTEQSERRSPRFASVVAAGGSMRLRDLFYRSRPLAEAALTPRLVLEEGTGTDQGPHDSLVLVHGHYWKDACGHEFDPAERAFLYEPFRADPRYEELRRRYRIYTYLYPSHAGYDFSASALAHALREQLPVCGDRRDITILAHSMGGLVARYALQQHGIGERVNRLVTMATPHRGTILASIIMANENLRRKIGWVLYGMQRLGRRVFCPSPGMMGMSSDNYDGRISPEEDEVMGIAINHELARLNASDPYLDRLVCLMGRVDGFWMPRRTLWDQIPRWVMGGFDKVYRTLDPLIHLESGIAEGLPVGARHILDGLDHEGILTSPRTHDVLYDMLLAKAHASEEEDEVAA